MSKLRLIRELKGISQADLSKKAGVSVSTIQKYEQNNYSINKAQVTTVVKLAEALECNVTDILEI